MADSFNPQLNDPVIPQFAKFLNLARSLYTTPPVVVVAILGIAVALRIPDLNESLWYDELWATHVKLGSLYGLGLNAVTDVHPPFYLTFMFVWIRLFGDSELSVRLPPLLFGLATIVLTYLLCSRFVGKVPGLIAALLVAISPAHIWYSQEARHYSALVALVLLALFAYVKVTHDRSGRGWSIAYALASLAMVFTFYFSLAYVALTSVMSLWRRDSQKTRILAINLVVMLTLAAFLSAKIALIGLKTGSGHLREFDIFELWVLLFNWFPTGNAIWPVNGWGDDFSILIQQPLMLLAHLFLLALLVAGLLFLLPRFRKSALTDSWQIVAFFVCLPGLLFLLTLVGFRQIYIERSLLTVMPFFYGILAFGLVSLPSWLGKMSAGTVLAALCVFGLLSFYSNRDNIWTVYKPNPDWRSTASYLTADIGNAGRNSVIMATTPADALYYYDARFQRWTSGQQDPTEGPQPATGGGLRNKLQDFARSFRSGESVGSAPNVGGNERFNVIYLSDLARLPVDQFPGNQAPGTVYVIHNLHWSDDIDALKGRVEQYPGATLLEKHAEEGMVVFKFRVGGIQGGRTLKVE